MWKTLVQAWTIPVGTLLLAAECLAAWWAPGWGNGVALVRRAPLLFVFEFLSVHSLFLMTGLAIFRDRAADDRALRWAGRLLPVFYVLMAVGFFAAFDDLPLLFSFLMLLGGRWSRFRSEEVTPFGPAAMRAVLLTAWMLGSVTLAGVLGEYLPRGGLTPGILAAAGWDELGSDFTAQGMLCGLAIYFLGTLALEAAALRIAAKLSPFRVPGRG